ncbi:hypothetical protein V8C35DRAFT_299264 [Trichoderma chlorosporum]
MSHHSVNCFGHLPTKSSLQSLMAAKPSNLPALNMVLAPQYENHDKRPSPHLRIQTAAEAHNELETNQEQTSTRLSHSMDLEAQDTVLYNVDRLVQDLLASRKDLKNEKRKLADKDIEIALLKQEVACLRDKAREDGQKCETVGTEACQSQRVSVLNSAAREEVNELQQLLAYHKTKGEQVSRKLRELQATNEDLETQLQVTATALQEQMSLLSGLGIRKR